MKVVEVTEGALVEVGEQINNAGLPYLPGIDVEAGLSICVGNRQLYRKLLKRFRETELDFEQAFLNARSEENPELAIRHVHTLKGVAANLGVKGVQQAAAALEVACADGAADVSELLRALTAELKRVLVGLEGLNS